MKERWEVLRMILGVKALFHLHSSDLFLSSFFWYICDLYSD